ncbi:MAG: hypothetical protein KHZ90_08630 [Veillonella parvula]|uniref:Uncharacterized protein n=1 Tax=Veillonella parvula TaxID=29466 RepID=A0A942WSV2_VEIPA|nr:hypothetical protein [Veillonella parvula]MBS4893827.1 hypothetical protein [Veillonella parvula]
MIKNLFKKTILLTTSLILTIGLMPSNQNIIAANTNITKNNTEINNQYKVLYDIDFVNSEFEFKFENSIYNFKDIDELNKFLENQKEMKNRSEEGMYYTNSLETNQDLQKYSEKFLKEYYNLELNVLVEFNNDKEEGVRGTFYYDLENHESLYIDINTDLLDCLHEVERTLRHELTHMALFELGRNFDDNEEDFESENYINGGRSNSDTRQPLPLDSRVKNNYCCD